MGPGLAVLAGIVVCLAVAALATARLLARVHDDHAAVTSGVLRLRASSRELDAAGRALGGRLDPPDPRGRVP